MEEGVSFCKGNPFFTPIKAVHKIILPLEAANRLQPVEKELLLANILKIGYSILFSCVRRHGILKKGPIPLM